MLDGELKIAASLGVDALQKSFLGAAIGFLAILSLWLIFFLSNFGSLCRFRTLYLRHSSRWYFKILPQFVLTLSGIAGSILSVEWR